MLLESNATEPGKAAACKGWGSVTLHALEAAGPRGDRERAAEPGDAATQRDNERLLCVVCAHRITSESERAHVSGSHEHTFANPHGFVYRIGCFLAAPGCAPVGGVSTEFPWFPETSWQTTVCGRCGAHLGWRFASSDHAFFGLILAKLVRAPGSGSSVGGGME